MIQDFHFLRPWWLAAILPMAFLWWMLRRRHDPLRGWRGVIAPRLLPFLVDQNVTRSRFGPLELIGLGWLLTVLAIAGPTWRREPAPFADDVAALAIVVKVTPSMTAEDVPPNRLARGVEKVHDLLAQRRGQTSLVAYSGTAHIVMPTTSDDGIINTFAQALDPKIMPSEGDAVADAFRLADETLRESGGSIVWIADSVAPEQAAQLTAWRANSTTPVRLLAPLPDGPELSTIQEQASGADIRLVTLSPDDADVQQLARDAKFVTASSAQRSDRWHESGYWLTPVLVLVTLVFFRRGWMVAADH